MSDFRYGDLAHDLRNLLGLVRAMSAELNGLVDGSPDEARTVVGELDLHTRFAMDALRMIEKWDAPEALDAQLGAWAWALRLSYRELAVGELAAAPRVKLVVPRARQAGAALLRAMTNGRAVRAELADGGGGVVFETASSAADGAALEAALGALGAAGLRASVVSAAPCRVLVRPG